jgi:hypothetical protein
MRRMNTGTRWAVGTLALVAIALSVDSVQRTRDEFDGAGAAPKVIRRQLDAFNRGDYRAAYQCAAPEIQEQFPLADFRRMVENGYPQIARSRSATFGEPEVRGRRVNVPVTVTGQDGVTVEVTYIMRHEPEGWRVAGVVGQQPAGPPPVRKRPKPTGKDQKPQEMVRGLSPERRTDAG